MKPETVYFILDLAGLALMVVGLVGLVIDVVWGLWTQDGNAILFGLAAIGAFWVGMKTMDYSASKQPK